jgi:hypothetical protein
MNLDHAIDFADIIMANNGRRIWGWPTGSHPRSGRLRPLALADRVTSLRPLMDNALQRARLTRRVAHSALNANARAQAPGRFLFFSFPE